MATHIKNLLRDFLKNKKGEDEYQQKISTVVAENLGVGLKKYIHIKNIRQGVIVFHSATSSATYEFMLGKKNVLEAVQKKFPEIKDFKITIRK